MKNADLSRESLEVKADTVDLLVHLVFGKEAGKHPDGDVLAKARLLLEPFQVKGGRPWSRTGDERLQRLRELITPESLDCFTAIRMARRAETYAEAWHRVMSDADKYSMEHPELWEFLKANRP